MDRVTEVYVPSSGCDDFSRRESTTSPSSFPLSPSPTSWLVLVSMETSCELVFASSLVVGRSVAGAVDSACELSPAATSASSGSGSPSRDFRSDDFESRCSRERRLSRSRLRRLERSRDERRRPRSLDLERCDRRERSRDRSRERRRCFL